VFRLDLSVRNFRFLRRWTQSCGVRLYVVW